MGEFKKRDTDRAKALRNAATPAERALWRALSTRKVGGAKFSRQMPIGPFFADFVCRGRKLVVELDGYSHDVRGEADQERDAFLRTEGYHVLRFGNDEVKNNLEGVVAVIDSALASTEAAPPPTPPASGRGVKEADPAFDASGHRARLRSRLIEGGDDALLDHELVEYLLMLTIPRVDTKPIARRLLDEFGGFGRLLAAEPGTLARAGISEAQIAAIRIAQVSAARLLKSAVVDRPVLANWQSLADYLHAAMAHRETESARVLYLNTKNVLIRDELISEGSIDHAAIYVREVVRRALELHTAAIVLVHNHPSGDTTPSKQDIAITREIVAATKPLGIHVHDHVIVGSRGHASFRSLGLL